MRVLGVLGWSGSGKTTLLVSIIPLLTHRGLNVSTIKHAHHGFDMDRHGKDTYRHRQAGAHEVLVATAERWALLHEVQGDESSLPVLLARMDPVHLVLVEGFRSHPFPKLEVHRPALAKPAIWPTDPEILAIASDVVIRDADRCVLPLNNPGTVAAWVLDFARSTTVNP